MKGHRILIENYVCACVLDTGGGRRLIGGFRGGESVDCYSRLYHQVVSQVVSDVSKESVTSIVKADVTVNQIQLYGVKNIK
jgi:hypothetical protein